MDLQPIFYAANAGDNETLTRLLEEQPQIVGSADHLGMTVLHHAAISGSVACVKRCLDAIIEQPDLDLPSEINRRSYNGQDALAFAISSGDLECVKLVINSDVNTGYSSRHDISPPEEGIEGFDPLITQYLMETLRIDYSNITEMENPFSLILLNTKLDVTMEYFKLLKSKNMPYSYEDFYTIWTRVIIGKPETPGMEEFVTYFCQDAVERWGRELPAVKNSLMQVSQYCLSHLVCHKQTMQIVNRLRHVGAFFPPVRLSNWLTIFREWGVVRCPCMTEAIQKRLLHGLAGFRPDGLSGPIVDDQQLLASILFLAVLATRFPKADWLQYWHELCKKAGIPQTSCTFQRLLQSYGGGSYVLAFWQNIFIFVLSRILAAIQWNNCPNECIKAALEQLLRHSFDSVPTLHPKMMTDSNFVVKTLLYGLWAKLYISKVSLSQPMFINFCQNFLFPWLPFDGCTMAVHAGLPHLEHKNLFFRTNYLQVCLDFSPTLALGLLMYYPFSSQSSVEVDEKQVNRLCSICILALAESSGSLPTKTTVDEFVNLTWLSSPQYNKVFAAITTPSSLFKLAKIHLRILIRMHIDEADEYPKIPLSRLVDLLQVAPELKEYVIEPSL